MVFRIIVVFYNANHYLSDFCVTGLELKDIKATLNAVTSLLNANYPWLSSLRPKASLIPVTLQTFSR